MEDGGKTEGLAISESGRIHNVTDGTVLRIGRGAECEIWLDSQAVSRLHASISSAHGTVIVKDLGSRNGVFVNGEKISGEARIGLGDRVLVGDRVLMVVSLDRSRLRTVPQPDRISSVVKRVTGALNQYAIELDTLNSALAQGRNDAARAAAGRLCQALGNVQDVPAFDRTLLDGVDVALLRLAEQADDALWLDELLRVHCHLRAVIEVKTAESIVGLVDRLRPARETGRAAYVAWSHAQPLTFSERAALKRLAAAKSRRRA